MRTQSIPVLAATVLVCTGSAAAQLRAVTYNVAGLRGDTGALADVFTSLEQDDKLGFATAPALMAFQEVSTADRFVIEALVAQAIRSASYATATFTSSPAENSSGGAQLLLYRDDLWTEIAADHLDLPTGGGRNSDRWHLQLVGYDSPLASLWVYSAHLKAGDSPSDIAQRLMGAQLLRADADGLPAGAHILFCGDFNLSGSGEPAYLELLGPGPAMAVDPLGAGSWSSPAQAAKHTQSPRDIFADGLAGGGMDDRFDFQLVSTALADGAGLSIMPGSCRALGNDGAHFNLAINDGNNLYYPLDPARSNALADDLFDASDHLPVIVEYQVPAVMSCAVDEDFGAVIQGADFGVSVQVANIAAALVPEGADLLEYAVEGFGALGGQLFGVVEAGSPPDVVAVPLDTSTPGFVAGVVVVDAVSEAAQNANFTLFTSGFVLLPANASLSADEDVDVLRVDVALPADSGVQTIEIEIANFGFAAGQALLDVDAVEGLGGPLTLDEPLPSGIGADPGVLVLAFDTDVAEEVTGAAITVHCTDEDLPGATASLLGVLLTVTLQPAADPADLDGDGLVNGADLGLLLGAWGPCPGCPADLDGSGAVDGGDLGALLSAWR